MCFYMLENYKNYYEEFYIHVSVLPMISVKPLIVAIVVIAKALSHMWRCYRDLKEISNNKMKRINLVRHQMLKKLRQS